MQADQSPQQSIFSWIEQVSKNGNAGAALEQLAARFRFDKQYRELFDARLMQKRLELGLPLVSQPAIGDLPKDVQQAYQDAYVRAAQEVGELFLAEGNIPRAWPYFRAIGNTGPLSEALETFDADESGAPETQEALGATIQIAFQEGVNPRKGFELILKHHGLCRAITMFSAYPQRDGRDESLRLLVRSLHSQLVDNLKQAIAEVEGALPETNSVAELIAARDWLFDNNAQHTDSSHLAAALRLSLQLEDEETLRLAREIADYGSHLGPMFQYLEDPPFDRVYEDHGIYLSALLGEGVDRAITHFKEKAAGSEAGHYGIRAAEVLIQLLVRLERYDEAIRAFRRYLADAPREDLACPSLAQLCQMAGDFEQLKDIAKQQSDPLSYIAAIIQSQVTRESL